MPLFGGGVECLTEQAERLDQQGGLTGACAAQHSTSLDDIEGIDLIAEALEPLIAKISAADPQLDRAIFIFDMGKCELAHDPAGSNDSASNRNNLVGFGNLIKIGQQISNPMSAAGACREWLDPSTPKAFELGQTLPL
jgi:hypothetical protein